MFFRNHNRNIAVLVADSPSLVAFISRSVGASLDITSISRADFEREWQPLTKQCSDIEALRKLLRGELASAPVFGPGALDALIGCFPTGKVAMFDAIDGFVHCFAEKQDAALAASRRGGEPIIFETAQELARLPHHHLAAVAAALDASPPPAKPKPSYIKELFDMATKAKKKAATKIQKVRAGAKRADGPVAKVHAIYAAAKDPTDTAAMLAAAAKAGIKPGTSKTQLYMWRKANGIKAARGRPGKVDAPKKAAPKKAAPKKAAPKKAAPKKAAPKKAAPKKAAVSIKKAAAHSEAKAKAKKPAAPQGAAKKVIEGEKPAVPAIVNITPPAAG